MSQGGQRECKLTSTSEVMKSFKHGLVQWAAMEFLLASYKKHRTWIWLKQLLLLLARMAAVILVVAMLAQPKTRDQWLAIFGGRVTHHFVVVDDSYSMSDRVAGASASGGLPGPRNSSGRSRLESSSSTLRYAGRMTSRSSLRMSAPATHTSA